MKLLLNSAVRAFGVALLMGATGDEDGYLEVPVQDDVNYGIGAAILALIETSGLPE